MNFPTLRRRAVLGAGGAVRLLLLNPSTLLAQGADPANTLSTVMPWEAWYFGRGAKPGEPSPFKWTLHFSLGVPDFIKAYVSQWSQISTNKKVGVLYPNDADGNAVRASLAPALQRAGITIVDAGPNVAATALIGTQWVKAASKSKYKYDSSSPKTRSILTCRRRPSCSRSLALSEREKLHARK